MFFLSFYFVNSELCYSYGVFEGCGKVELVLQYKKLCFGKMGGVCNVDVDFYNYFFEQEWYENSFIVEVYD